MNIMFCSGFDRSINPTRLSCINKLLHHCAREWRITNISLLLLLESDLKESEVMCSTRLKFIHCYLFFICQITARILSGVASADRTRTGWRSDRGPESALCAKHWLAAWKIRVFLFIDGV